VLRHQPVGLSRLGDFSVIALKKNLEFIKLKPESVFGGYKAPRTPLFRQAIVDMTSSEPINVDDWIFEEELEDLTAGCPPIKKEDVQEKVEFSPPPHIPMLPGKSRPKRSKAPRRHPEDADTQDRVLAAMVDEGFTWEYIAHPSDLAYFPELSRQNFPIPRFPYSKIDTSVSRKKWRRGVTNK